MFDALAVRLLEDVRTPTQLNIAERISQRWLVEYSG